jgi:histidinol-phosphate aminotransferase
VVDEAYGDYAGTSLRPLRERFSNVAILRTLSKIGFAGLRVGWMEGPAPLVAEIDKVRQPFNVPAWSQTVASLALREGAGEIAAGIRSVVRERERVAAALADFPGVIVAPRAANFLWVHTPTPAHAVFEGLALRGVLVRSFHKSGGRLAHQLRITVGTASENDAFLDAFAEVMAEVGGAPPPDGAGARGPTGTAS